MCTGMRKRFLMSENGGVAVSLYRMEYKNQTGFYRKEGSLPGKCAFLSQKETPRCLCFHASFTLEAAVILPLLACFFVSVLFFFRSLPGKCAFLSQKETPRCLCFHASFTLEAAVILPLLACFFVSVLFFFRVMQIEIIVQKTLDDTGRKLAVYLAEKEGGVELLEAEALFLKELTGKELPEKYIENGRLGILTGRKLAVYLAEKEGGVELLEAEALFLKELTGKELPEKYIENGRLGILLLSSQFDEREVALEATYHIKLPIQMFAIDGLWVRQNAVCRKWNGWKPDQAGGDHEEWVYITETGRAYHREDTCSYLDLSIRSVKPEQLDNLRNENGGKYHPCSECVDEEKANGNIYITNYGDRYHNDLNCSGIKRTNLRNENGGKYHPCSECVDEEKANGNIYITNYGDRYHNDLNCSGIKRTIYMVKLRDVGGRTPCKRCGAWKE